jgi:hypothetical protein
VDVNSGFTKPLGTPPKPFTLTAGPPGERFGVIKINAASRKFVGAN